jgi:SAM-dependent methyltransferase
MNGRRFAPAQKNPQQVGRGGDLVERVDFNSIYKSKRAEGRYDWHDLPLYAERVTMAEAFLRRNRAGPRDKVLFLGCGAGHTLRAIAEHGFAVSGVDISEEAISWAKEKTVRSGLTADLRVCDVSTLESYTDASFRFVLDDYCLQCVIGPARASCFSNVYRVLQPGGAFHAGADRASESPDTASEHTDFDSQSRCLLRDGIPYSYLTRGGELEREVVNAGFVVAFTEHRWRPGGPSYHAGRDWVDAYKAM